MRSTSASASPESTLSPFPLDFGSIRSMIEYRFSLLDAYVDVNGLPAFVTVYEPMKEKFIDLLKDLGNHHLSAKIRKVNDKLVISVFPKPQIGRSRKWINLVLFLATVAAVGFASYLYTEGFFTDPRIAPIVSSNSTFESQMIALAVSILGIVGIHESGHVLAARHHRMNATLPYFFPAPPPIGTFGAVISLRFPPSNRDQLFDLGFSGPFAGFLALLVVAVFTLLSQPLISTQQANALLAQKVLGYVNWPQEPLLLELLSQIGIGAAPAGYVSVFTGVEFAVQIGALITFLNLLPVWQLDGGHITRAVLGSRGHKAMAVVAFAMLLGAGYWPFAILLVALMFWSRRPLEGLEPLDDVSPLSNTRKVLFVLALAMLVLCFVIIA